MGGRPARPNLFPARSTISKSPSTRIGPLFLKVTFVGIDSPFLLRRCELLNVFLIFGHGWIDFVRPGQNSTFEVPNFTESGFAKEFGRVGGTFSAAAVGDD